MLRSVSDLFSDALVIVDHYGIDETDANATRDQLEIAASRLEPLWTPPMPPQPSGAIPQWLTRPHVSDELLAALGLTAGNLPVIALEVVKTSAPRTAGAAFILAQIAASGAPEAQIERVREALAKLELISHELKKRTHIT